MIGEQLERTRIQRAKDALVTKATDARNHINRFFGAKVCGACEGCSGGNCDSCKGKPAVSIWDAANSSPAMEDVQSIQPEKPVSAPPEIKAGPDPARIAIQPAGRQTDGQQAEQLRAWQAAPADDSRLIRLRAPKAETPALSGASLIRAGLLIESAPEREERTAGQPVHGRAEQTEMQTESGTSVTSQPMIQTGITTVNTIVQEDPPAGSTLRSVMLNQLIHAEIPAAREPEAKPAAPANSERAVTLEKPEQGAEPPVTGPQALTSPAEPSYAPDTILENPCMQAILKMKYHSRAKGDTVPAQPSAKALKNTAPPETRPIRESPALARKARTGNIGDVPARQERKPDRETKKAGSDPDVRVKAGSFKTSDIIKRPKHPDVKNPADARKTKPSYLIPGEAKIKEETREIAEAKYMGRRKKPWMPGARARRAKRQKEAANLLIVLGLLSKRRKRKRRMR